MQERAGYRINANTPMHRSDHSGTLTLQTLIEIMHDRYTTQHQHSMQEGQTHTVQQASSATQIVLWYVKHTASLDVRLIHLPGARVTRLAIGAVHLAALHDQTAPFCASQLPADAGMAVLMPSDLLIYGVAASPIGYPSPALCKHFSASFRRKGRVFWGRCIVDGTDNRHHQQQQDEEDGETAAVGGGTTPQDRHDDQ